jgi:branched-subunit amino acid transport protein
MSVSIFYAILVTSLATFLSRFLGVLSSVKIKETSKIFNWFNCLAYSTLAALIARTVIFPVGVLSDASYLSRLAVVVLSLMIFLYLKKIMFTQLYFQLLLWQCLIIIFRLFD